MSRYGEKVEKHLIAEIKRSLVPPRENIAHRDGRLRQWFLDKLERIAPVILVGGIEDRQLMTWVHIQRISPEELAVWFGISRSTIYDRINRLFEKMVDDMPYDMAAAIIQSRSKNWRLGGCLKCGGDMWKDIIGFDGWGPAWACFQCGYRVDLTEKSETLVRSP